MITIKKSGGNYEKKYQKHSKKHFYANCSRGLSFDLVCDVHCVRGGHPI